MRLVVDTFDYCSRVLRSWNTISISGYHIREAGSSAAQEIGFTLANGIAYVRAATEAGLAVDEFAPRLSFFFAAHNNLFEEAAKFRAARRMWAKIMREEFGAQDPKSWMLRFHTQTGGVTLTAQQPENNIVRVAYQCLAAVLGGTQSLHSNGFDEALALPTEHAATLALRTQQILAEESGVTDTADPLAGSWYVESLTDELEAQARSWIAQVDEYGGAVNAIDEGFVQAAIAENAYRKELARESGDEIIVGVNKYVVAEDGIGAQIQRIDRALVEKQMARVTAYKAAQDRGLVDAALDRVEAAARGTDNLLPVMKDAFLAGATLGQIVIALKRVFGEHRASV
jgi:methylmalonyl-CoA mutase N-terminal domain/subunit